MIAPELVDRALAEIKKSVSNYDYFFEHLKTPDWLEPLKQKGFFTSPPKPDRRQGSVSFPFWPESRYLARMAANHSAAKIVFQIAERIPTTENIRVHGDLVDVALALPPELGARFVPEIKNWLGVPYASLLPAQAGRLIVKLASSNQVAAALDLSRSLFEVATGRASTNNEEDPGEPRAKFDNWNYSKILNEVTPVLIQFAQRAALSLLAELLTESIEAASERPQQEPWDDQSWIWRRAIEDHGQNQGRSAKDALVTALRDGALAFVQTNPDSLLSLVVELESRRWAVFRRLALFMLAQFPDAHISAISERLSSKAFFDDSSIRHEYFHLSRVAFAALPESAKELILSYVAAGLDLKRPRWNEDGQVSAEDISRYTRQWQLQRLAPIRKDLPPEWSALYEKWARELGEPEHPDFLAYSSGGWFGAKSPRTADELRNLSMHALAEYLSTWQPSGGHGAPSREGLGEQLHALVSDNPRPFAVAAAAFRGTQPSYVRSIISGFQGAATKGNAFDWEPLLDLCAWVLDQEKDLRGEEWPGLADEDKGWGWTRKAIADLLAETLSYSQRAPPVGLKDKVWMLLSALAEDPDPTPSHEEKYGPPNTDPFTLSLNTTRGRAIDAVIDFIQWSTTPEAQSGEREWIGQNPLVAKLLERHLKPEVDPSLAVRSVYGQRFPNLFYSDARWSKQRVSAIFSTAPEHQALRSAAWDAYVTFTAPNSEVFKVISGEYENAVQQLSTPSAGRSANGAREHLAEHLMILYWWGDLELGPGTLLERFFAIAPDDLRGHALDFVGRSLNGDKGPPPEIVARLQTLWEHRLRAGHDNKTAGSVEELSNFGWWFASRRFNDSWSLETLRSVIKLVRKVEPAHVVVKRLAELVESRPLEVVRAFAELVESDREGWLISASSEDALSLLKTAVSIESSREEALALVHLLGAKGHSEFRAVLAEKGR